MLNKCKTLIITKRHVDRKGSKNPTVSLPGRKQTIKIKHKSHKDSLWTYFRQRAPHVPIKRRWHSFHRQWCSKWWLWGIRKGLSYILCALLTKAAKCFIQASLSGPKGLRTWPSPTKNRVLCKTTHWVPTMCQARCSHVHTHELRDRLFVQSN